MKYIVTINDKNYEVEVEQGEARVLSVNAAAPAAMVAPAAPAAVPVPAAPVAAVSAPIHTVAGEIVHAPMPGQVLNILKKLGDPVQTGDVVLIMEAMKMENEIVATKSGTIAQVHVAKGANVTTGDPLVTIG